MHQAPAQGRADPDADREGGKEEDYDAAVCAERHLGEGRQLRQRYRANEPEPGRSEDRQAHFSALPCVAQNPRRCRQQVPAEPQVRCGSRSRRHPQARGKAETRADEQQDAAGGRSPGDCDRDPAGDSAGENREKGAGLHQGVAVDQLGGRKVLRQQRVFDRARKRRLSAQHEQQDERESQVAGQQSSGGAEHGDELGGFEDLQQSRTLEPISELPGRRREEKERRDQGAAGDGRHHAGVGTGGSAVGDQHNEGALEQIVVERPGGLRQQQRHEAPRPQQLDLLAHSSVPLRE